LGRGVSQAGQTRALVNAELPHSAQNTSVSTKEKSCQSPDCSSSKIHPIIHPDRGTGRSIREQTVTTTCCLPLRTLRHSRLLHLSSLSIPLPSDSRNSNLRGGCVCVCVGGGGGKNSFSSSFLSEEMEKKKKNWKEERKEMFFFFFFFSFLVITSNSSPRFLLSIQRLRCQTGSIKI